MMHERFTRLHIFIFSASSDSIQRYCNCHTLCSRYYESCSYIIIRRIRGICISIRSFLMTWLYAFQYYYNYVNWLLVITSYRSRREDRSIKIFGVKCEDMIAYLTTINPELSTESNTQHNKLIIQISPNILLFLSPPLLSLPLMRRRRRG